MTIDLGSLARDHPVFLDSTTAGYAVECAVLALQRANHQPGGTIEITCSHVLVRILQWDQVAPAIAAAHDNARVTEDGTDAVCLAVVHDLFGWRAIRRLQRRTYADWLLVDREDNEIAFEVAGRATGSIEGTLQEEVDQLRRCRLGTWRVACVVQFERPRCILQMVP